MKVKKEIIEAAMIKLIDQITATMPDSTYKFILGGASAFAALKSHEKIVETLGYISDENGLVDVEILQSMIDGAFKASDNKLQIEFFNNQGLLSLFVKPIKVTISKDDIMALMAEIRQNSVSNEVTLNTLKKEQTQDIIIQK